jgi:hypothetical protein
MTTKSKNARSLDVIADDINKLERANIFDVGDLLLEAKSQCEHGDWLSWLNDEFDMSVTTAERRMNVAKLSSEFPKLKNLKLAAATLNDLADHDDKEDLPSIIGELAKHARKARLKVRDAEYVIKVGIGRRRFGDHPDATLDAMMTAYDLYSGSVFYEELVAALQEQNPDTDEAARLIHDEVINRVVASRKVVDDEVEDAPGEIESILDGPPPVLPPPTASPEPQKLAAGTEWAETKSFVDVVKELQRLGSKPIARFVGMFPPTELHEVAEFLVAVAAADESASVRKIA